MTSITLTVTRNGDKDPFHITRLPAVCADYLAFLGINLDDPLPQPADSGVIENATVAEIEHLFGHFLGQAVQEVFTVAKEKHANIVVNTN